MHSPPILILSLFLFQAAFGQDRAPYLNAASLVPSAQMFFAAVRTNVDVVVDAQLQMEPFGIEQLGTILHALDAELKRLQEFQFGEKLDLASKQVEAVQLEASSVLKDPANKAMAEGFQTHEWIDQIARQKATGRILEKDLDRLRGILEELRRWASLMIPVAPSGQVAEKLKVRLLGLQKEWRDSQSESSQPGLSDGKNPEAPDKTADANAPLSSREKANHDENRLPPEIAIIVALVDKGADEKKLASYIKRQSSEFGLTQRTIQLIDGRVSATVMDLMLDHDRRLREKYGKSPPFWTRPFVRKARAEELND